MAITERLLYNFFIFLTVEGKSNSSTIFFSEFMRSIFQTSVRDFNSRTNHDDDNNAEYDDVTTNSHSIQINISSVDDNNECITRGNQKRSRDHLGQRHKYNGNTSYVVASFNNDQNAFCSCGLSLKDCHHQTIQDGCENLTHDHFRIANEMLDQDSLSFLKETSIQRRESMDSRRTSSSTTPEELQIYMLQVKHNTPPAISRSISVPCPRANSQRPSVVARLSDQASNQLNTIYLRNISFQSVSKHTKYYCGCFSWRKTKTRTSSFVYGGGGEGGSSRKRSNVASTVISNNALHNKHTSITSLSTSSSDGELNPIHQANNKHRRRTTTRRTKDLFTNEVIIEDDEENEAVDHGKCFKQSGSRGEEIFDIDDANNDEIVDKDINMQHTTDVGSEHQSAEHSHSSTRHNYQHHHHHIPNGHQILKYLKSSHLFHHHHNHNQRHHRHQHRRNHHCQYGKRNRSQSIHGAPFLHRESMTDFYSDDLDLQEILVTSSTEEEDQINKTLEFSIVQNDRRRRRRSRSLSSIEDIIVSQWWGAGNEGVSTNSSPDNV